MEKQSSDSKNEKNWECQKHGNQKILYSNYSDHEGIRIAVYKGKKTLSISGWYDGGVGLRSIELSLEDIQALFQPEKKE